MRPETVNYRTQKPEKDGLFCERIFGPSKDWECYCGKYKKIRYKGIICDKCGVEVTRSLVRRERMGHIDLKAPVSHIWFLRGVPSKIGLMLDLSVQALEKVIYFANFIITEVNEDLKKETLDQIKQEYRSKKKQIEADFNSQAQEIRSRLKEDEKKREEELVSLNRLKEERLEELREAVVSAEGELKEIKPLKIISENVYQDLSLRYGHVFEAGIGGGAIRELLEKINLEQLSRELEEEVQNSLGAKKAKAIRRSKLVKNFIKNNIRPEWTVLTTVPIIPPDLRPMVPLDGGRFATSDLNDLYRRVINRNNRLKQLIDLNAPEVICRNEKRMLQEAVDALIDNSARHGKTVVASTGQRRMLKSIADMLKGKQGRFRQNLLGKRIDYSGRSVIVIGPTLKLYQCGLPKTMALELFKPFIISRLIQGEFVHNVRSANRFIESKRSEVWDILEDIVREAYVLLNRAPTLHRLGIQAFKPVLIEGKAIQIHPLVCTAFNADFDGDQMAVHVPLTEEAVREAKEIMLASVNLLKPATGDPVVTPNQDIVWGAFYMTHTLLKEEDGKSASAPSADSGATADEEKIKTFSEASEAIMAYELGHLKLQDPIRLRIKKLNNKLTVTTTGRILFNDLFPDKLPFYNETLNKKRLGEIVKTAIVLCGSEKTADMLDKIKSTCFAFLTKSGMSWGMDDLPHITEKEGAIKGAEKAIDEIEEQFDEGLLTQSEKHSKIIDIWTEVKDRIEKVSKSYLDPGGSVFSMIDSGARGSWGQLTQIIGMKGLVTNPVGEIIELPVKGSFKEGFDVLEYFISTHGARKGLSDIALRTANAGYLTRRLIDVSQDAVITEEDCGDTEGLVLTKKESEEMGEDLIKRITGRVAQEKIINPKTKTVIVKANELIDEEKVEALAKIDLEEVKIRSLLSCKTKRGVCQRCYGYDLGHNDLVKMGVAVGIVAAQSIGEPGTQLTMRTFHTGGVAGLDITQGLPRVEEIFEARPPKKKAIMAEEAGVVSIEEGEKTIRDEKGAVSFKGNQGDRIIKINFRGTEEELYNFEMKKGKVVTTHKLKDGQKVKKGEVLFAKDDATQVKAKRAGLIKLGEKGVLVLVEEDKTSEYLVPRGYKIWVSDGDLIDAGAQLTEGSLDLQQLYKLRSQLEAQKYIIREIQYIYSSQGQKLNDKHIELIARQMFSRVYVKEAGDTDLLPGEVIEKSLLEEENSKAEKAGGQPAQVKVLLLGMTKASLATSSFLSAASFQETARVLINAAVNGRVDKLVGLKENVINYF